MQVHRQLDLLPQFTNAVITIGTFDGVHNGHRTIIKQLIDTAKQLQGESVLITFEPHPRLLTDPQAGRTLRLLNTLDEKLTLLNELELDHVVVVPFTRAFAVMQANDYIEKFLIHYFHPAAIIIGYDHHFGFERKGNIEMLKQYQQQFAYQLIEIPSQLIDTLAISSTQIRNHLLKGDLLQANKMMGTCYQLSGTVIQGKQLGRTINLPTANIHVGNAYKLIPCLGVYAVKVNVQGSNFSGVMNIGTNPTTDKDDTIKIEVFIFDFDRDIYGEMIRVELHHYLRAEARFASLHEMMLVIEQDIAQAKAYFN